MPVLLALAEDAELEGALVKEFRRLFTGIDAHGDALDDILGTVMRERATPGYQQKESGAGG